MFYCLHLAVEVNKWLLHCSRIDCFFCNCCTSTPEMFLCHVPDRHYIRVLNQLEATEWQTIPKQQSILSIKQ